jgi:hypothetical protein
MGFDEKNPILARTLRNQAAAKEAAVKADIVKVEKKVKPKAEPVKAKVKPKRKW